MNPAFDSQRIPQPNQRTSHDRRKAIPRNVGEAESSTNSLTPRANQNAKNFGVISPPRRIVRRQPRQDTQKAASASSTYNTLRTDRRIVQWRTVLPTINSNS